MASRFPAIDRQSRQRRKPQTEKWRPTDPAFREKFYVESTNIFCVCGHASGEHSTFSGRHPCSAWGCDCDDYISLKTMGYYKALEDLKELRRELCRESERLLRK